MSTSAAKSSVLLNFYKDEYDDGLRSFYLPDEQLQFSALPHEVLKAAAQDSHRYPVVILADSKPVGFFVLYDGEEIALYSDDPQTIVLRAFSVNHAEQGKGYAKQGLLLLPDFVRNHFPLARIVGLGVNMKNITARNLYLKCGFEDHGRTKIGPLGPQHILTLPL
ncbi:GNAT family N-acetyltransferase [Paenibacillus chitinolyticus]|uniref:GNAT family N-acetyltransferase n=1 Tax=Paenibacillus chitinolyticus TaxID=79263 RepID=UPI00386DD379